MGHEQFDREEEVGGSSNRTFGLVFAALFGIIGLLPLVHGKDPRLWAIGVAVVFLGLALFIPSFLSPVNRLWIRFGLLLHRVVSPLVLGVIFFAVITPMGICMRLLGKDLLRLRLDQDAASYWIERKPPGPAPDTFQDQF
jgi:hypothetical protein